MGFFATNKVKKVSSRLDTYNASNSLKSDKKEGSSLEVDSQYATHNTFRSIEYHKQNHRIEVPLDHLMDPLDHLWH